VLRTRAADREGTAGVDGVDGDLPTEQLDEHSTDERPDLVQFDAGQVVGLVEHEERGSTPFGELSDECPLLVRHRGVSG
jgi:hypothetical protein